MNTQSFVGSTDIRSQNSAFQIYVRSNTPEAKQQNYQPAFQNQGFPKNLIGSTVSADDYAAELARRETPEKKSFPGCAEMVQDCFNGFKHRRCRRNRKPRTTFTLQQSNRLELEYSKSEYISGPRRLRLAESLQLHESQIKIWYQNRRAKDKRIEKAQIDGRIRYWTALSLNSMNSAMSLPHVLPQLETCYPSSQGRLETLIPAKPNKSEKHPAKID